MTSEKGFALQLDTKAITDAGEFEGYASTFGNVDMGDDIVCAGAFTKSLAKRPAAGVKMIRDHDLREPVGVWSEIKEDSRGLKVKGRLILETTKGRETHILMKAGALDSMSIGYRALKARFDRAKGARLLEEVDLFEISVLALGMNPKATVSAVKGHPSPEHARELVRAINAATAALRA